MKLTNIQIKAAEPRLKKYNLTDGNGLYLLVKPNGGKYWRYNYVFHGKQGTYSYGVYPDVTLKQARELHTDVKRQVKSGIDPSYNKKISKILNAVSNDNSFEFVALEFIEGRQWGESTYKKVKGRLNNYVFPYIGKLPIADVTAVELLALLRQAEKNNQGDTAHRVRSLCGQIFRYGMATQRCSSDPAAALIGALRPVVAGKFAALTDPVRIGALLRDIDNYSGAAMTRLALRFSPLVMARPGEIRHALKDEFDLGNAVWTLPADKMKMKREHIVPLSKQALAIVVETFKWSHPKSDYLFHAMGKIQRPLSENTINNAIRAMGYSSDEMTAHGFRAMASTLLNEQGYDVDWIEVQLAHEDSNKVRGAYNRAKYLPQRRKMMQEWADYLDGLR